METEIVCLPSAGPPGEDPRRIGRMLAQGAVVAFPTETVYGLAAARDSDEAVRRLIEIKGRPEDKPLTVHVAERRDIESLSGELHIRARRLIARLLPGPVTLVLPGADGTPTGFRLPDHAVAREFLGAAGTPVVATSANLSGGPPLTDGKEVARDFDGVVDAILDAGPCRYGAASTVVDATGPRIAILREGVIPSRRVREAASLTVLFICTGNLCRSPMAEGIFRHLVAERLEVREEDLTDLGVRIHSAGTAALSGEPATPPAVAAAAKWGADIDAHRAQPLTPTLIRDSDLLVTAEIYHAQVILTYVPEVNTRIRTLRRDREDVRDPYGRSAGVYRRVAAEIREEMTALADEVVKLVRREEAAGD